MITARVVHAYLPGRRFEEHDANLTADLESSCWCDPDLVFGEDDLTGIPVLAVVHSPRRWTPRRARRGEYVDAGQVARISEELAEELVPDGA